MTIISEGKAEILFPEENQVFYNPVQEFNRDLSIVMINTWQKTYKPKSIHILEALSATGLRSIRYAKELSFPCTIIANDFDEKAVETITKNTKHNHVEEIVTPSLGDANIVMYKSMTDKQPFDMIDLDPYGSASTFIDAAVRSISDGGLLAITCTDMAVLAGSNTESCFAKYGGSNIPNAPFCHELLDFYLLLIERGLRILLHLVQGVAARYEKWIEPMASLSIDFYVRVFVKINHSPKQRKLAASKSKTSMVYYCHGCKSYKTTALGKVTENGKHLKFSTNHLQVGPNCLECNQHLKIGGPFYSGPLHDKSFLLNAIESINSSIENYNTSSRMIGMLTLCSQELDDPFYYSLSKLSKAAHFSSPKLKLVCNALLHLGYNVSLTHSTPGSIKTNASSNIVWDILRCWIKKNPVVTRNIKQGDPALLIIEKQPLIEANFNEHDGNSSCVSNTLLRYQMNPQPNWGPKSKAQSFNTKRKNDVLDDEKNDE